MSLINDALKRANKAQRRQNTAGPLGVPIHSVESIRRARTGMPLMAILGLVVVAGGALWCLGVWWGGRNQPEQLASALPTEPSLADQPAAPAAGTPSPAPAAASPQTSAAPAMRPNLNAPTVASVTPAATAVPPQAEVAPSPAPVAPAPKPVAQAEVPVRIVKPAAPAPPIEFTGVVPAAQTQDDGAAPTFATESGSAYAPTQDPPTLTEPARPQFDTPPPLAPDARPLVATKRQATPTPTPVPAPVAPAPSGKSDFAGLKLQGIFYLPSNPSAIINRETLHVGDSIGGARVVEIGPKSVTLEMGGARKVMTISGW